MPPDQFQVFCQCFQWSAKRIASLPSAFDGGDEVNFAAGWHFLDQPQLEDRGGYRVETFVGPSRFGGVVQGPALGVFEHRSGFEFG